MTYYFAWALAAVAGWFAASALAAAVWHLLKTRTGRRSAIDMTRLTAEGDCAEGRHPLIVLSGRATCRCAEVARWERFAAAHPFVDGD